VVAIELSSTPYAVSRDVARAREGPPVRKRPRPPQGGRLIVVDTTEELKAALIEANAGRRILVRAGTYVVDRSLNVPNGATLQGEGVMLGGDLPAGFAALTETRIVALRSVAGDLLTLGNDASVQRLVVEDVPDRVGNTIAVGSRGPDTSVSASIVECEIVNPNPTRPAGPDGPNGGAIVALTLNLALDDDPPPHAGAVVNVGIRRSIVRAVGRALFAMNFAPDGRVNVDLTETVVAGTLEAFGGISRPDAVAWARTTIVSRRNLYLPTGPSPIGWMIGGGSSPPFAFPLPAATSSNEVRVDSTDDRIEGFRTGIEAFAGRRHGVLAGPSSDSSATLELRGLKIQTTGPDAADFRLMAAFSFGEFETGHRNTLRVDIRDSMASGPRANFYAHVAGPVLPENFGEGNRLAFIGTPAAFAESNTGLATPPAEFFTDGG
jgi:hypothetical protein